MATAICKRCATEKAPAEFYQRDRTCKECRKAMVKDNRAKKADYYREYDRMRFKDDPRVRARHRRYQKTEAGKEAMKRSRKRWIEKNKAKRAAHVLLGNAVRDGKVEKPEACDECGSSVGRLHGHHDDYLEPLDVRWLCAACHHQWHAEHGEAKNADMEPMD